MQVISKWLCGGLLAAGLVLGGAQGSWAQSAGMTGGAGSATAEAKKRINEMQTELNGMRAERTKLKETLRSEFEAKEEWKGTVAGHKKAKAAYEQARKQALASVKAKPEYKQLVKEREALIAKQDELSQKRTPDPDAIAKVGTELAKKGTAIKNLERDAEKADEKALAAKDDFDAAKKKLAALDEEVENALYSDPDFEGLEQKLQDAETQLATAREQLVAQQRAESAARASQRQTSSSSSGQGGRGGKGGMGKGYGKGSRGGQGQ